jgi:hypothetical protein
MTTPARHPDYWVASGPVTGTDWCYVPDAQEHMLAPGHVVLCVEGTSVPHPDAERAATSAWALIRRWASQGVSKGWQES